VRTCKRSLFYVSAMKPDLTLYFEELNRLEAADPELDPQMLADRLESLHYEKLTRLRLSSTPTTVSQIVGLWLEDKKKKARSTSERF
jgi:hypothetical protein